MANEINKLLFAVAAFALGLVIGGYAGTDAAQKAAAREKAEMVQASVAAKMELQDKYRKQEQDYAEKLSKAIEERDEALADLDSARTDAERVRRAAEGYKHRLSAAAGKSDAACKPFIESLGRCTRLLAEGADLVDEGCGFSGRVAADHDALAALLKSK